MSPNAMEELNALLEERTRYERWLAQLDANREQTPVHVFDRVRTDYRSRLDQVMGRLRKHGGDPRGAYDRAVRRGIAAPGCARRDRAAVDGRGIRPGARQCRAHGVRR